MIRNLKNILIIAVILLLTACNKPTESPLDTGQPADTMPVATESSTDLPPTDAPNAFEVDPLDPTVVVFDFVDLVCSAAWSTNASYLTCPGHLEEAENNQCQTASNLKRTDPVVQQWVLRPSPLVACSLGVPAYLIYVSSVY